MTGNSVRRNDVSEPWAVSVHMPTHSAEYIEQIFKIWQGLDGFVQRARERVV